MPASHASHLIPGSYSGRNCRRETTEGSVAADMRRQIDPTSLLDPLRYAGASGCGLDICGPAHSKSALPAAAQGSQPARIADSRLAGQARHEPPTSVGTWVGQAGGPLQLYLEQSGALS